MDKYEVKITDEALADMEKIYEYIEIELLSPENAMRQMVRQMFICDYKKDIFRVKVL